MVKLSKRMRLSREQANKTDKYSLEAALKLLQSSPPIKFDQSVEVDICLNVSSKKPDAGVRGVVVLPHGTGRKTRVIFLSEDKSQIEAAIALGVYRAGSEELINEIKQGECKIDERDTLIATPAMMPLLAPLGSILGPKGLMPNPKLGTVTSEPALSIREALSGRVQYRSDKGGVIRCLIGKLSFSLEHLKANLASLFAAIIKHKSDTPSKSKGFVKKVVLSSTMGPGLCVDQDTLDLTLVS